MNDQNAKDVVTNNVSPEPPELLDGVSEVRKCSFRPEEHFIKIRFQNSDLESYYLEVKWRRFWFLVYCKENGIKSYSIEEQPAAMIAGTSLVQSVCVVKMDGEIAGQGIGAYSVSGTDFFYAAQQAATIAQGRALANAGFGSVFTSASASESGGREVPCDSGLFTSEFFVQRNPNNPMVVSTGSSPAASAEKATASGDPNVTGEKKPMTRDEALRFVLKDGSYAGETLGDLMGKRPSSVSYYATNARFRGTDLQTAAKLVLAK